MATPSYVRLPGRSNGFLNSVRLWEADDHLLLVESYRVSESYRRFFYRDIQAIVICQTRIGLILTVVFALLAMIQGGAAYFVSREIGIFLGVFAGLFFLIALIHFLRGPTCRCVLRTAVQAQNLRSLNRVRTARKVLARLRPKIADNQRGTLPE